MQTNTLARVIRNDSASVVVSFKPEELGNTGTPSAGLLSYQFPSVDLLLGAGALAPVKVKNGNTEFSFPVIDQSGVAAAAITGAGLADPAASEHEKTELEKAVYEKKLQESRAAIEAELHAETGSLRENLTATIDRISSLAKEVTAKLESEVVELALEIAKKIVAREINTDREVVLAVTRTALTKLHARTLASVHLHPDNLVFVQENRDRLNFHGSLELIEDKSITPGGCLIHTDAGDIDARIESQFDEIAHGLLENGSN